MAALLASQPVEVGELAWDRGDEGVGVRDGDEANDEAGELLPLAPDAPDEFREELDGNDWFSSILLLLVLLLLLLLLASSCSLLSFSACFWARNLVRFSIIDSACYKINK